MNNDTKQKVPVALGVRDNGRIIMNGKLIVKNMEVAHSENGGQIDLNGDIDASFDSQLLAKTVYEMVRAGTSTLALGTEVLKMITNQKLFRIERF